MKNQIEVGSRWTGRDGTVERGVVHQVTSVNGYEITTWSDQPGEEQAWLGSPEKFLATFRFREGPRKLEGSEP